MQKSHRRTHTGKPPENRRLSRRRAFTLMEILVVIALLASVAVLATMDFDALFDGAARRTPLEALAAAMENGRERALNTGGAVRLAYDPASASLRVSDANGTEQFPVPDVSGVTFTLPAEEGEGSERSLDAMLFHPSGYTTPAVIELAVGGSRTRYRVERFSASLTPEGEQ